MREQLPFEVTEQVCLTPSRVHAFVEPPPKNIQWLHAGVLRFGSEAGICSAQAVSGLFSAKTVVHLSTAPAVASFEHAVAVCTETPALNRSTTTLIA
jgi:hypothetical protein